MTATFVTLQTIEATTSPFTETMYTALPYHPQLHHLFSPAEWAEMLMADPETSGVMEWNGHASGLWVVPHAEDVWVAAGPDIRLADLATHLARAYGHRERVQILLSAPVQENAPHLPGWHRRLREEVLSWERHPERGPLHDPPEKWYPIALETFWHWHRNWEAESPLWPRSAHILKRLTARVPTVAYGINVRDTAPAGAMLFCAGNDGMGYIADLIWAPDVGPRNVGRYLLQTLYLYRPTITPALDLLPVTSGLNRVLMALGYRVYRRWWYEVWERA